MHGPALPASPPDPCPASRNPHKAPQGGYYPFPFLLREGAKTLRDSTTCARSPGQGGSLGRGGLTPLGLIPAQGGPPRWKGAPRVPLAFELLHDLQEAVVGGGVAAKADLHLVQIGEGVFYLQRGGGSRWARVAGGGDEGSGSLRGRGWAGPSEGGGEW